MHSIDTLQRDLIEEAVIVSLVIIVFLFHFRSALIAILALPIAVLMLVHPDVLAGRHLEHHVAGRPGAGHRRAGRCRDRDGRERLPPSLRTPGTAMRSQYRNRSAGAF